MMHRANCLVSHWFYVTFLIERWIGISIFRIDIPFPELIFRSRLARKSLEKNLYTHTRARAGILNIIYPQNFSNIFKFYTKDYMKDDRNQYFVLRWRLEKWQINKTRILNCVYMRLEYLASLIYTILFSAYFSRNFSQTSDGTDEDARRKARGAIYRDKR